MLRNLGSRKTDVGFVAPQVQLLLVRRYILLVHFPHLVNLIQVHHEALLVCVLVLDALSAKNGKMVRAVEVLHPLVVFLALQALEAFFTFEVDVSKNRIPLYDLVQDVEVKRQLIDSFDLLHQLPANRAAHSVVVAEG